MYSLSDYTYLLPEDLIAQEAVHPHHDARLMVIDRISGKIQDESTFWNLGDYLGEDRVIFFNNSQVLQARIRLKNQKYIRPDGSDGIIHDGEILFCKKISPTRFEALVRPGNKFRIENKIVFPE